MGRFWLGKEVNRDTTGSSWIRARISWLTRRPSIRGTGPISRTSSGERPSTTSSECGPAFRPRPKQAGNRLDIQTADSTSPGRRSRDTTSGCPAGFFLQPSARMSGYSCRSWVLVLGLGIQAKAKTKAGRWSKLNILRSVVFLHTQVPARRADRIVLPLAIHAGPARMFSGIGGTPQDAIGRRVLCAKRIVWRFNCRPERRLYCRVEETRDGVVDLAFAPTRRSTSATTTTCTKTGFDRGRYPGLEPAVDGGGGPGA